MDYFISITRSLQKVFILLLLPVTLFGQRSISGRITDAEDGAPIPLATVFIANSTAGTVADAEGYYTLEIPGEGSYRLTVSHVGYQPAFIDIKPGKESIVYDIALIIHELDEVAVTQKVRARQKDIALFWQTLLGRSPSKRTVYALNPEVVFYYFNSETQQLTVTCREPLQIINNETGYQIQAVLEHFTHNYNTDLSSWQTELRFSELRPENIRQKSVWDKKRREIYKISLPNFIKALYHNTLMENGYLLTFPQKTDTRGNTYEKPDVFLSVDSINDNKVFRVPANSKNLMLVCFGEPVTELILETVDRAQNVRSEAFVENINYRVNRKQNERDYWLTTGLFRNVIETPNVSVRIFPDGTTDKPVKLSPCLSSSSLTGLNMKLPTDYDPDVDTDAMSPAIETVFADREREAGLPSNADRLFDPFAGITNSVYHWFNMQLEAYPQEKIHLHTDRDMYVSGEKIWFKAYVTDALTHRNTINSRYVYVELISPSDSLIKRVMVRPVDSLFFGQLSLVDYVPTGNYTLRAYTRYMENLGDDYFFKKNIRIENPATASRQQHPPAHRVLLKDDYEVSFFPEGGNLPEGVISKVAFKALNINGYPETVTGVLVDEAGVAIPGNADVPSGHSSGFTTVQSFHAGMGVFEHLPKAGKRVYLKCRNRNGLEKLFELPQPDSRACSLTASLTGDSIVIGVSRSAQTPDRLYYLLAHCRGEALYFSEWENENGRDVRASGMLFTQDEFPAGIIQFVLFDEQMNPLSERLVFNKKDVGAKVTFNTDKASYTKREKVRVTLNVTDTLPALSPSRKSFEGHFSVAVTDDREIAVDESTTILSSMLLSSELKGYIENPALYLQDTKESAIALDYLMLIHGWRRYHIPEVTRGILSYPQIPFQLSRDISGKVKNSTPSKNVTGSEVTILSTDGNYGITTADRQGVFKFQDIDMPDSAYFLVQALNRKVKNRVEPVVDEESFPELIHAEQSPFTEITVTGAAMKSDSMANALITKAVQRSMFDEDMRVIHLSEVEITAKRIEKDPRIHNMWATAGSDFTYRRDDFDKTLPVSVTDLFSRYIKGVSASRAHGVCILHVDGALIDDGKITPPLILVDGNPTLSESLEQIPANQIESIDVFRTHNATRFGVKGMTGGVISITTRKWSDNYREDKDANYTVYTPLGYQKPVEFYSPNYEKLEAKYLSIPDYRTTIFWKPDIVISDTGEASFEFYASDFPTMYSVVIEGLTSDGKVIRQVEKIRIE